MTVTGLLLFLLATRLPFLDFDLRGRESATTLVAGPAALEQQGMWEVAMVVLITTIAAPAAKLAALAYVLFGLRLPRPPRHLYVVFRWVEWLSPWSMIEVFLLGVFVAYSKLIDIAPVQVGGAVYALGGLMLAMAAADATLGRQAVWDTLERKGVTAGRVPPPLRPLHGPLTGCDTCGLVCVAGPECPRCGASLRRRKPNSISRTWALLVAAAILYIPANVLPVMTLVNFGWGQPATILGGVRQLAAAGMWPLAALVFFASITVPVLKLIGLAVLLISIRLRSRGRLRERTQLYRIIDSIGRWSMIDVFMISILTSLVRMGLLASLIPGPGVISFCSVVILTMFAAMSFDPRLMWDRAGPAAA
jgi:paraquat-inducible protein A